VQAATDRWPAAARDPSGGALRDAVSVTGLADGRS